MAACARCGATDRPLVLAEGGEICPQCEQEGEEAEALDVQRWALALAPVIAVFAGTISISTTCLPPLGLVGIPLAALLGVAALVGGVRNFLTSGDAEDLQRTALVLSGAIGVLGGLALVPLSILAAWTLAVSL